VSDVRVVRISSVSDTEESTTELDNHADTCVVGNNALIVFDSQTPVSVTGFDKLKSTVYQMVTAALAYDDPRTGETVILVIHQAIHVPHLTHNLLCCMQMRMNDVEVDECPKFLARNPTDKSHALTIPGDTSGDFYTIPLSLKGVTSYFPTRKPTMNEYENSELRYELTYAEPEWNPQASIFNEQEQQLLDVKGQLHDHIRPTKNLRSIMDIDTIMYDYNQYHSADHLFGSALSNCVHVRTTDSATQVDPAIDRGLSTVSMTSQPRLEPQILSRRWGIGLNQAKQTILKTTQRGIRSVLHPTLSRRFRTNDRMLRYRRLPMEIFSDTLISKIKSQRGNLYAQVYGARNGWTRAFPMKAKSDAHESLSLMFARDGVPPAMIVDGAKEQTLGEFRKKARQADCHLKQLEPFTPWANAAEGTIREIKRGFGRKMVRSKAPKRLWDHCLELEAAIRSHTAHQIYQLNGEVPETIMSGETADITPYCAFEWYEWVKFRDTSQQFPDDNIVLGRYLGTDVDVGTSLTAKILKKNGEVVYRSTYRPLTDEELQSEAEKKARTDFDAEIERRLGPSMKPDDFEDNDIETPTYETYEDDDDEPMPPAPDADEEPTPELGDNYLHAEVLLPRGDTTQTGRVIGRKRDAFGNPVGIENPNPILDTRVYQVEFPDGDISEYSANVIAENMWSQCDLDGNQNLLLDCFVEYKKDGHAVEYADRYITYNGRKSLRRTTKGWHICVQWKDGTTSWERLADLKESYPIDVAEYAVAQGIDHEPAFCWWVPHTLKKRNRIIATVSRRYAKRTYKFGIKVPRNVDECRKFDHENGNTLWMDAVRKEMKEVQVAFRLLNDGEAIPPGYQEMSAHLVFDVKMEDFRRKARYVADGYRTETPANLTYASVVSRDTVRIALTIAALNALEVKTSDIQNAYLTAPCVEKIWLKLGPEWGADEGKKAFVVRSLYGLKSAGQAFRNHLADCMRTLGYFPSLADPDLWMKAQTKVDGQRYYSYILLYVDDCLCIHEDAAAKLHELDKYFKMKPGSICDPDIYLGAKVKPFRLENGVVAWGLSSSKYVQEGVRTIESFLMEHGKQKLKKRVSAPFPSDYYAELDSTPELEPELATHYQNGIGILRWCVELGRVDIITEVSVLSSYLAMPRQGHLDAMYHIFAYLKIKHNARLVLDPSYPDIDERTFVKCDWRDFYGNIKEPTPPNAPAALGKEVDIRLYVDSSHADDRSTRRSRTGFFVYINNALITWVSKKQATIETSVFGAEFVAMKHGIENVRGLRYKLRMMGIQISGPTYVYGDNMSVINNTSRPESTLKKKSNSVCYHFCRESAAMDESIMGHVSSEENRADIATKIIGGGRKRDHLIGMTLHDIVER
jgi:hypothetical protein